MFKKWRMLYKDFPKNGVRIKDVDTESGVVTGYFAIFGEKDSDGDIIQRGAFAKTIAEKGQNGSNRIKHLYQHDMDQVLAKPTLREDEKGLYFESKIAGTTLGNDVLQLYAEGVLDEHSIGFVPIKEERSEADGANVITEIDLWEGSTVTWGAQEMARVDSKSRDYASKKIDKLRKAIRDGNYTEETFYNLEQWLMKLMDLNGTHGDAEPPHGTPEPNNEPPETDPGLEAINEQLRNL